MKKLYWPHRFPSLCACQKIIFMWCIGISESPDFKPRPAITTGDGPQTIPRCGLICSLTAAAPWALWYALPTTTFFTFDDFDLVNELFDGSQNIEVSTGSGTISSFGGDHQCLTSKTLAPSFKHATFKQNSQNMITGWSQQPQSKDCSNIQFYLQSTSTSSTGFDSLGTYPWVGSVNEQGLQGLDIFERLVVTDVAIELGGAQAVVPYAPPAGAFNSLTRVAAEWNIQRTPEAEEIMAQIWNVTDTNLPLFHGHGLDLYKLLLDARFICINTDNCIFSRLMPLVSPLLRYILMILVSFPKQKP